MTHFRHISERLIFSQYTSEHMIEIPKSDGDHLEDVEFQIYGELTPNLSVTRRSSAIHDLHIYIDGINVTNSVIASLRILLDETDEIVAGKQYHSAMHSWLDYEERLGHLAQLGVNLSDQRELADKLSSTRPLSKLLTRLGDTSVGDVDRLHIFHYLYRDINLEWIAASKVIAHHNQNAPEGQRIDVFKLAGKKILMSAGKSRRFAEPADPGFRPNGALALGLVFQYRNPLEEVISDIRKELDLLRESILIELEDINDRVGSNGPIQRRLQSLETISTAMEQKLVSVNLNQDSQSTQIAALQDSINQLREAIRRL